MASELLFRLRLMSFFISASLSVAYPSPPHVTAVSCCPAWLPNLKRVLVRARVGICVCICVGQLFIPVLIVILAVRQIAHTLRVRSECHSTVASLPVCQLSVLLSSTTESSAHCTFLRPVIHPCRCSLSKCQNSLS